MPRKYWIVLFFMTFVGARHAVPLQGLPLLSDTAFAATQENGQPCPPECITDSMEIVTWYPSPYNEYEELRLYPISDSNSQCNSDNRGLMYYDRDEDKVKLCKGPAGLNNWQDLGGSAAKMAWGVGVCSADNKGEIAYNVTQKQVQFCDGTDWLLIANTVADAPTLLSVQGLAGSVLLKWSAPANGFVESYKIYRRTSSGSYSLLASVSDLEYTDAAISTETRYYYKLKSVNSAGESVFSDEIGIYVKLCVADAGAVACNSNTAVGYYWQAGGKIENYSVSGLTNSGIKPVCDDAHLNTTAETGAWNGSVFWEVMTDWYGGSYTSCAPPCGVYSVTCKRY